MFPTEPKISGSGSEGRGKKKRRSRVRSVHSLIGTLTVDTGSARGVTTRSVGREGTKDFSFDRCMAGRPVTVSVLGDWWDGVGE